MKDSPKKKRVASEEQVRQICRLLQLWPQCPVKGILRFVSDTLGIKATRACLQEAKEKMGISTPQHKEITSQKMNFAKHQTCLLVGVFGLTGLAEEKYIKKVTKLLKDKFRESTKGVLVKKWVLDILNTLQQDIMKLQPLTDEYGSKVWLDKPKETGRQNELL